MLVSSNCMELSFSTIGLLEKLPTLGSLAQRKPWVLFQPFPVSVCSPSFRARTLFHTLLIFYRVKSTSLQLTVGFLTAFSAMQTPALIATATLSVCRCICPECTSSWDFRKQPDYKTSKTFHLSISTKHRSLTPRLYFDSTNLHFSDSLSSRATYKFFA